MNNTEIKKILNKGPTLSFVVGAAHTQSWAKHQPLDLH
jgi:hypothetical protein